MEKRNLCDSCLRSGDCSFQRLVLCNSNNLVLECKNYKATALATIIKSFENFDSCTREMTAEYFPHSDSIPADKSWVKPSKATHIAYCGCEFDDIYDALSRSCSYHQNSEKEKSDSFTSRFMPNVKFKTDVNNNGQNRQIELFLSNIKDKFLALDSSVVDFILTSACGEYLILCSEKAYDMQLNHKEVSIYEAIPELVPEGKKYDKQQDKLIDDPYYLLSEIKMTSCDVPQKFDDSKADSDGIIHKDDMFDTLPFYKGYLTYLHDKKSYENKNDSRSNGFIKHDLDKVRYDLVCPYAYEDLGRVLTFGAKKYSENNWMKGDINTYIAAMERHLSEIKKALNDNNKDLFIDKDSGLQHGSALMVNGMFIHYFIRKNLEEKKC